MNDMLTTKPDFSLEEAGALLARHFGLQGALAPLDSERDQNFKVATADGDVRILKIINAAEPEIESDFQSALLKHLGENAGGLPVPRLYQTLAGASLGETTSADGLTYRLRLVGWLPGGTAVVVAVLCAFFTTFTGGSGVTILALRG